MSCYETHTTEVDMNILIISYTHMCILLCQLNITKAVNY
jgi:hypothetical protein